MKLGTSQQRQDHCWGAQGGWTMIKKMTDGNIIVPRVLRCRKLDQNGASGARLIQQWGSKVPPASCTLSVDPVFHVSVHMLVCPVATCNWAHHNSRLHRSLPQPHLVTAFTQDLNKLLHNNAPKHSPHPRTLILELFYGPKLVENSLTSIFGLRTNDWVVHGNTVYSKTRSPTSSFFLHLHETGKWDLSFNLSLSFLTSQLYPYQRARLEF